MGSFKFTLGILLAPSLKKAVEHNTLNRQTTFVYLQSWPSFEDNGLIPEKPFRKVSGESSEHSHSRTMHKSKIEILLLWLQFINAGKILLELYTKVNLLVLYD